MSDNSKTNTNSSDRHPALRSSSVPSSCLRSNRDSSCRRNSIVRNVSFPADESRIVSGFLEPANPWEYAGNVTTEALIKEYVDSCYKHGVSALPAVLEQIKKINFDLDRNEIFDLKGSYLTVAHCEALEEIFKRVQFVVFNVESTGLDDEAATSLFDMLEYYESATHLNMSENHLIDARGWQACSRMIKRMRCLENLEARSVSLNEQLMPLLTRSLRVGSQLQVLKLENCKLSGRPFLILVSALKLNTNLKELYLGENLLDANDAAQIGLLLKCNNTLQFLDISNNIILDAGLGHIAEGLSEQTGPGLNMLVVWNNHLTYHSAEFISIILARSSSLEMLNIGQNLLTNDVLHTVKETLQQNHILLKLGMQSTHLTCEGAISLAEAIADNNTLQRIDLRDNNFQIAGLMALCLSMKENTAITQLDLDDTPRRYASESVLEEYRKLVEEIRSYCARNKEHELKFMTDQDHFSDDDSIDWRGNDSDDYPRLKPFNLDSRKISLTCETLMKHSVITQLESNKSLTIEPPKSGGKLRSPAPSPVPSPVTSPSPTRSRFHVSKVSELSDSFTSTDSNASSSPSPSSFFSSSRFKVTVVEPEKPQVVISVPSTSNTTVGFDCQPSTDQIVSEEPKITAPVTNPNITKLNKPIDSLDITALKIKKQPAVEVTSSPMQRSRKISLVAPAFMFSFSQSQMSTDESNKPASSLDRLLGLFKSPFSQFQQKQQTVSESETENENKNSFFGPQFMSSGKSDCVEREKSKTSDYSSGVSSSDFDKSVNISDQSHKDIVKQSSTSSVASDDVFTQPEFTEEDDRLIITISENVSKPGSGCPSKSVSIGMSGMNSGRNFSDNSGIFEDSGTDSLALENVEPPGARSVLTSSDDTTSSIITTDEISYLNEEKCRDSTSELSCELSFDKECGSAKNFEPELSSFSTDGNTVEVSGLLNSVEKLNLVQNNYPSCVNTNDNCSSNQINNNQVFTGLNEKSDEGNSNSENASFDTDMVDACSTDNDGGCEFLKVQNIDDSIISDNINNVNNSVKPNDSAKDLFNLSDINEKSNQTECARLFLPCKLATWPQGLGVRLVSGSSCQMEDKYRSNSAPCLVEAATVVLFQTQLPSDLSLEINKLSPTKCDDARESSTNLQMAT